MKYRVIGCDRETGIDVAIEIEASSVADAGAKANKLGILISGSPAVVSAPAVIANKGLHSPLLIASVCVNLALAAVVFWTQLRQPGLPPPVADEKVVAGAIQPAKAALPASDIPDSPRTAAREVIEGASKAVPTPPNDEPVSQNRASFLQVLRDEIGVPADAVKVKYDEFKNRSTFSSGKIEITSPKQEENAIFIELRLYGEGRTAKKVLKDDMFHVFAASFVNHTRAPVPISDYVNWIVDGDRFEGKERETITRLDSGIGGYSTSMTNTSLSPGLRAALASARSVKVQVMGVACELDEQSIQHIRKFFSELPSR